MLRKLLPLLLLLPLAARAGEGRDDGEWSGDDQYSWQSDGQWPGDAADGYGPSDQNRPPPADDYNAQQDDPAAGQDGWRPLDDRTNDDGWRSQRDDDWRAQQYGPAPDAAPAGPSMNDFRSGLNGYGRWVDTAEYGWVWQPTQVSYRWQPYWDGRWAWTTAGWTWVTDEPWGWATYHYGRWALLDGRGWVWLPGRVWAPAWVAWRWGGGYAGWCPLGPRGVVYVQPRSWVFVETPFFMTPIRRHAVPVGVIANVWTRAQPMPFVRPSPRAGPPPRIVEQHTRVPVRMVPIVEVESRAAAARPASSGVLPIWRPRTVPYPRQAVPASSPPARAQPDNGGVQPGNVRVQPGGGGVAGAWRQQFPAPQPRPSAPALQPQQPPAPAPVAQPVRPAAPAVRPPERTPAAVPRGEREDREPSVRPHAQPLNEARETEKK